MNNKELKLILDCDKWNIVFFYDNKQMGRMIEIEPNNTYYAAIIYNTRLL